MTATNHALTGTLIGLVVRPSILALVLALLSHFLLDAIPHYSDDRNMIGANGFKYYLIGEALLCFMIVMMLAVVKPSYWQLAAVCAFVATSPDFMWMPAYFRTRRGLPFELPKYTLAIVHAKIQWFARPIGAVVELVWLVGISSLIFANVIK